MDEPLVCSVVDCLDCLVTGVVGGQGEASGRARRYRLLKTCIYSICNDNIVGIHIISYFLVVYTFSPL